MISFVFIFLVLLLFLLHMACLVPIGTVVCKSVFKYNVKYVMKENLSIAIKWGNIFAEIKLFFALVLITFLVYLMFKSEPWAWAINILISLNVLEFILMIIYTGYYCSFNEEI